MVHVGETIAAGKRVSFSGSRIRTMRRSKVTDRESVPAVTQHLIQRMADVLADETRRPVAQKEMSASDMERLETHPGIPVRLIPATAATCRRVAVFAGAGRKVDRRGCREPQRLGIGPASAGTRRPVAQR